MTGAYETRWQALRAQLEEILERAKNANGDEELVRLATLTVALLDQHRVNKRGRCQHCRAYRGWREKPSRKCTVLLAINLHLEQPRWW